MSVGDSTYFFFSGVLLFSGFEESIRFGSLSYLASNLEISSGVFIASTKEQFLDDDHEAMYSTLLVLEFYKNTKLKSEKWLEETFKATGTAVRATGIVC